MEDHTDSPRRRVVDTLMGALPSSVVRWAVAHGAPVARVSGRTSVGSAALAEALAMLARPPKKVWTRTSTVGVADVAEQVGRDEHEIRRWRALGLLGDPGEIGGEDGWDREVLDRAVLVDLALEGGADEDTLTRAAVRGNLVWAALSSVMAGEGEMTGAEAAESAGVSMELMEAVWRSLGLPAGELGSPVFDRRDIYALRTVRALQAVFSEEDLTEAGSVLGRAMAEVSSSVTDLFRRRLAEPFVDAGGSDSDVVVRLAAMRDLLVPAIAPLLEVALGRHLEAAIRSEISVAIERMVGPGEEHRVLSVAFADLVGFTAAAEALPPAAVRRLAETLFRIAERAVNDHGGRVVKGIGDAVMFTTPAPLASALAGLEIIERAEGEPDLPPVGVGISHGPVLPGYADYFGHTVNLASRLCHTASAGEVLVHADGDELDDVDWDGAGLRAKSRSIRFLKGIKGKVEVLEISRAGSA